LYARYPAVEPDRNVYPASIWQTTSTKKMDGITANTVDVNFLYKNYNLPKRTSPLQYGWVVENNKLYYYDQGYKYSTPTGWFKLAGKFYYINPSTKEVATGTKTINGVKYTFDAKGVLKGSIKSGWTKLSANQKYVYQNADGSFKKSQWISNKYYVDGNGYRQASTLKKIGSHSYYFDKNGVMQKSKKVSHKKANYYLDGKGHMIKNKQITVKKVKYQAVENGKLMKVSKNKVVSFDKAKYYFDTKGSLAKNKVITVKNVKYYAASNGKIVKINKNKIASVNDTKYYFDKNYKMAKNKIVKVGKYKYYFNKSGKMVKNKTVNVGKKTYTIDKNGHIK
jgi:glucan-binding YG repeat protein